MAQRGMVSERDYIYADIERCRREIAAIEAEILAGNPDIAGLCLALADWSGELRLLRASQGLASVAPRLAHVRSSGLGLVCPASLRDLGTRRNRGQKQGSPPRQCRAGQEGRR